MNPKLPNYNVSSFFTKYVFAVVDLLTHEHSFSNWCLWFIQFVFLNNNEIRIKWSEPIQIIFIKSSSINVELPNNDCDDNFQCNLFICNGFLF